ncbi:MAG: NosD domain-containing protein [Chlamydiota bacterium]|nr:NosD domain-containing protein [Chlamydiota bacterium]
MRKHVLLQLIWIVLGGVLYTASAADIHVPQDYSTIYEAVENSLEGDTIYLSPGTHVIRKTVDMKDHTKIIGDSPLTTFVVTDPQDQQLTQSTMLYVRDYCELANIHFKGEGKSFYFFPIRLDWVKSNWIKGVNEVSVHDIIVSGFYYGIATNAANSSHGTGEFYNNTIYNCTYGVTFNDWKTMELVNNTITNCYHGVHMMISDYSPEQGSRFVNNNIWGNTYNYYDTIYKRPFAPIPGNISEPPMFYDETVKDFRLQFISACVDAGTSYIVRKGITLSFFGDGVDIGAIENENVAQDIVITDQVHSANAAIDPSSFSTQPESISNGLIQWQFRDLPRDSTKVINFDLILNDPQPGEDLIVNDYLELRYTNRELQTGVVFLDSRSVHVYTSSLHLNALLNKTDFLVGETLVLESIVLENMGETREDNLSIRAWVKFPDATQQEVLDIKTEAIDSGQKKEILLPWAWELMDVPSGAYQLHIAIDQNVEERNSVTIDFTVLMESIAQTVLPEIDSKILLDQKYIDYEAPIDMISQLSNVSDKLALTNLRVHLSVISPQGTLAFEKNHTVNNLAVGSTVSQSSVWVPVKPMPGVYQVKQEVFSGNDLLDEVSEQFQIKAANSHELNVAGVFNVYPKIIGPQAWMDFDATMMNTGSDDIDALWTEISIYKASDMTKIHAITDTLSIAKGLERNLIKAHQWQNLEAGQYVVVLEATVQGVDPVIDTNGFVVDALAPTTQISFIGSWYQNTAQYFILPQTKVSFEAQDDLSGLKNTEYRVNQITWQSYLTPFVLNEDAVSFVYRSIDKVGNAENAHSLSILIDDRAPVTGVVSDKDLLLWQSQTVTCELSAEDDKSGVSKTEALLNGVSVGANLISVSIEGTSILEYWSEDHLGNQEQHKSLNIKIDKTAPISTAILSERTLSIVAQDLLSGISETYFTVDEGALQTGSTITISDNLTHRVSYWSVDKAGNEEKHRSFSIPAVLTETDEILDDEVQEEEEISGEAPDETIADDSDIESTEPSSQDASSGDDALSGQETLEETDTQTESQDIQSSVITEEAAATDPIASGSVPAETNTFYPDGNIIVIPSGMPVSEDTNNPTAVSDGPLSQDESDIVLPRRVSDLPVPHPVDSGPMPSNMTSPQSQKAKDLDLQQEQVVALAQVPVDASALSEKGTSIHRFNAPAMVQKEKVPDGIQEKENVPKQIQGPEKTVTQKNISSNLKEKQLATEEKDAFSWWWLLLLILMAYFIYDKQKKRKKRDNR